MGKIVDIFKKQGGMKLIRNYYRNHVLCYAVLQFLINGRSKTSLEFLRLGVDLKKYNRISKKYIHILREFDDKYKKSNFEMKKSNKVWIYWSTGMEKTAPDIVKRCFRSINENLHDREVILLSMENYMQYVDIPNYIIEKYKQGTIEHVHFADLLRIELLAKHGGTWIDSTVFCMNDNIPPYMLDSEFFIFQMLKPGSDGNALTISSWFITAYSNQKFILAQQALLRHYWYVNDEAIDYFFFHHFMCMIANYYSDDWKKMIRFPNSLPHVIQLMQFDNFDKTKYNAIANLCPFQKLTYKVSAEEMAKEGTYYEYIMNH